MIGIAYEVGAILNKDITLPAPKADTIDENVHDYVTVSVNDPDLCPYYGAFIIKDVEVKPAPLWMQNYLLAAGIRPINNVVDITNSVLLEYGQPLHAFDYDLLDSKEILVRRAHHEEKMVTLDDQTRVLADEHLLITNGKQGVAIAGVMGGANTEVNSNTQTVLLEAAYFDPQTVRKAVSHTGLRSEASNRFEKGIDPNRVKEAGLRACELFIQYANGKLVHGVAEFDQLDRSEKTVEMNAMQVNKRLGTAITVEEMEEVLTKLRFNFERSGEDFTISIPTRRGDITIFEDMLEEVARIYGYDKLPYTLPVNASQPGGLTEQQQLKRNVKRYLQSVGLSEAITYSLTDEQQVTQFISPDLPNGLKPVKLSMPMSEDHMYLRLSLIPELLNRLTYNVARKQSNVALYEISSVFLTDEVKLTKQPKEHLRLAGAVTGTWVDHPWQQEIKQVDFYVIKGIVEGLFDYLNISVQFEQAVVPDMHPGRCATIHVDGKTIGFMGQVHPTIAKRKDLKDTYVFDLDMEYLLTITRTTYTYEPIPKHPSILRDIAFVVDKEVSAGDLKKEIERIGAPLVKRVEAFDVYEGENIADNEKSIAYNVHYQHPDKTLTDKEVDASFKQIIETINEKFSAYVRS